MKNYERIRTCSPDIPMEMYEEAARENKYIATSPPVKNGRVELTRSVRIIYTRCVRRCYI